MDDNEENAALEQYLAIAGQLETAPCDQMDDGRWRCRFKPDGFGATREAAMLNAFARAVAMLMVEAAGKN